MMMMMTVEPQQTHKLCENILHCMMFAATVNSTYATLSLTLLTVSNNNVLMVMIYYKRPPSKCYVLF